MSTVEIWYMLICTLIPQVVGIPVCSFMLPTKELERRGDYLLLDLVSIHNGAARCLLAGSWGLCIFQ